MSLSLETVLKAVALVAVSWAVVIMLSDIVARTKWGLSWVTAHFRHRAEVGAMQTRIDEALKESVQAKATLALLRDELRQHQEVIGHLARAANLAPGVLMGMFDTQDARVYREQPRAARRVMLAWLQSAEYRTDAERDAARLLVNLLRDQPTVVPAKRVMLR